MKKSLTIFAILVLLGIGAYMIILNMPKASTKKQVSEIKIEASALHASYITNENAANNKYIGKIIEVSGRIMDVEQDAQGATTVILQNKEAAPAVLCTLEKGEEAKLENYRGKPIAIKGLCTGYITEVVLNKGVIVE